MPDNFEFQINDNFLKYKYAPCNIWDMLILKFLLVCLKLELPGHHVFLFAKPGNPKSKML